MARFSEERLLALRIFAEPSMYASGGSYSALEQIGRGCATDLFIPPFGIFTKTGPHALLLLPANAPFLPEENIHSRNRKKKAKSPGISVFYCAPIPFPYSLFLAHPYAKQYSLLPRGMDRSARLRLTHRLLNLSLQFCPSSAR
jgi:hypothetical protein